MDSNRINRWLSLGANFGVLIGIILLVVELDQNRDMIRAQTRNAIAHQIETRLTFVAGNPELASIQRRGWAGEELSADEEYQLTLLTVANIRNWENIRYQYRQGLFDESEFEGERLTWRHLIAVNQRFESIWCSLREGYSPEFAAEINRLIAGEACSAGAEKQLNDIF